MNSNKPKIIGITGGIGAGKTTVAELIKKNGFPVYHSDIRAKELMNESSQLKAQLVELLGKQILDDHGNLIYSFIGELVFVDDEKLKKLESLIHPLVLKDFENWLSHQTSNLVFKEAAILFESGSYKQCDAVILVTAPLDKRIERLQKRGGLTLEQIQMRLNKQWSDEKKKPLADFFIHNNGDLKQLESEVNNLIKQLID